MSSKVKSKLRYFLLGCSVIGIFFIFHNVQTQAVETNSNNQYTVSRVLTYSEMVEEISKNKSSIKTNGFLSNTDTASSNNSSLSDSRSSNTYRIISAKVDVNSTYKPTLKFFCETTEGDGLWAILQILSVSMDGTCNRIPKQFAGNVYANLEDFGTIYWEVNGDYFDSGTTMTSVVGRDTSISFTSLITNQTYHYLYCYKTGRYKIY